MDDILSDMDRRKPKWNPVRSSEAPGLIKWVEGYLRLHRPCEKADQFPGIHVPPTRGRQVGGWLVDDGEDYFHSGHA